MTANDAVRISQGYTRLLLGTYLFFTGFSLVFAGITVLSPLIYETVPYADKRIVMAMGYALGAVTMLLIALFLTGRSNAALALAAELMAREQAGEAAEPAGLFRKTSTLWALFFMTAMIIMVTYIVLIYAEESGLF